MFEEGKILKNKIKKKNSPTLVGVIYIKPRNVLKSQKESRLL